jgi:hypothetical protein
MCCDSPASDFRQPVRQGMNNMSYCIEIQTFMKILNIFLILRLNEDRRFNI